MKKRRGYAKYRQKVRKQAIRKRRKQLSRYRRIRQYRHFLK